MTSNRKFEMHGFRGWIALTSILLVLMMSGVEAMHAHSDAASPRASSHCAICISVHANAPATTVHVLPVLAALEIVAIPDRPQHQSRLSDLELFIRPPPAV